MTPSQILRLLGPFHRRYERHLLRKAAVREDLRINCMYMRACSNKILDHTTVGDELRAQKEQLNDLKKHRYRFLLRLDRINALLLKTGRALRLLQFRWAEAVAFHGLPCLPDNWDPLHPFLTQSTIDRAQRDVEIDEIFPEQIFHI